jgi:hypothetical protein
MLFLINALNLFSKSYSGLELPTKSKTVRQSFPSAKTNLSPIVEETQLNFLLDEEIKRYLSLEYQLLR